jgi:alkylation response protein AidB-like acyl-CoA dehydrogenase
MDAVGAARSLHPLIRAHADAAERDRRLDDGVRAALAHAGLFRMAAPAAFGGGELHPVEIIKGIEAVSEADGSTGWTLMIGVETVGIATAALPNATAERILGDNPDVTFSGAINALGTARRVDGGVVVDGRWPYASGSDGADWFWGGCVEVGDDGQPARVGRHNRPLLTQVVVPRADYAVIDTWRSPGLRGTGSHDVVLTDVFVPDDRTTDIYGAGMRVDTPLFRMPPYSRLAFNKVGVATGIARAALDAFIELATEKKPLTSTSLLRERPQAQLAIAEAEARLRATRAFVFEAVSHVYDVTAAGGEATLHDQAMVRLACSHCCAEAVRAVDVVMAQAGMSALTPDRPLERCGRDIRVVPQHVTVAPSAIQDAGRVLLGLDPVSIVF